MTWATAGARGYTPKVLKAKSCCSPVDRPGRLQCPWSSDTVGGPQTSAASPSVATSTWSIHHFLNGESSKVTLVRLSQDYALGMPCHGCIGCPWCSQVLSHGAMEPYCQVQRACGEVQHQGAASNSSIVWSLEG